MENEDQREGVNQSRVSSEFSQQTTGREEIIKARGARQAGGSIRTQKKRLLAFITLGIVVLLLAVLFAGPGNISSMFGTGTPVQKTSQIDLQVDRKGESRVQLDFVVPRDEKQSQSDNLNEKLKALQTQLAEVERNKQAEMQSLLAQQRNEIEQRRQLAEENARLKLETQRLLDEGRRAAAEDAALRAEETARRTSNAVIIDDSSEGVALSEAAAARRQDRELDKNAAFLNSVRFGETTTAFSKNLADPSRTVVEGTIISAVLETAIDTQLPGSLRAQIMEPVYSFDGRRVLMPQGTILIGQFNNDVDLAQRRVMIAWNRAITPGGKSIALGSIGTDRLGRSGTLGNVDNRYATKFGAALLISAITITPSLIAERMRPKQETTGTTINIGGSGSGSALDSLQGNNGIGQMASGAFEKYLDLPPVIRVPQGEEIRIFVNRDLVFR